MEILFNQKDHSMKKITSSKMIFLLLCAFLFLNETADAQSVKRQVISAMGSSAINKSQVSFTVGQPYSTNVFKVEEFSFRPGFQQAEQKEEKIVERIPFNFNAYPNPANQSFSIGHDSNKDISEVKIYSINGSSFYDIAGSNVQKIDCSNWEEGLYIISVTDETGSISTSKINIQH